LPTPLPSPTASVSGISQFWGPEIQRWDDLILLSAEAYEFDPDLIAAIIAIESGGNENIVSHSGACGLMQVMASDTASVEPQMFKDRPTCQELKDPAFNVEWGTSYLAVLYRSYKDLRDALKHYGPRNVDYYYADLVLELYGKSKN